MSNLVPSVIRLDKGLNLQTAKIVAPPGSLLDCLNYEQVDFQGQKRIDGYVRYDGSLGSYADDYYVIELGDVPTTLPGEVVTHKGRLLGVVVKVQAPYIYVVVIDETNIPTVGEIIYSAESGINIGYVQSVVKARDQVGVTDDQLYENLLEFNAVLRDRVGGLPGPIAGLHWFRDRLYAVAGMVTLALGSNVTVWPNDVLSASGNLATVVDVVHDDTSIQHVTLLGATDEAWSSLGTIVYNVATGAPVGAIVAIVDQETATFYEALSEQQAADEEGDITQYGWVPKHLGWSVPFSEGVSLYGSLPSLNQNISGLGVQGPTTTTGDNGRPLALRQKVNIPGEQVQVNGWKSSNTPNSYNLDPNNVRNKDSLYIYADAFIEWSSDSTTVTAPGLTSGALVEYLPTNTVEVDI